MSIFYYDYDDVFIIPSYSDISTRKNVDTSVEFLGSTFTVPIIATNMDTIVNSNVAIELRKAGALAALHRFQTIESAVDEFEEVALSVNSNFPCLVSVGVSRDSKERAEALYVAGARHFEIDIAHGHSEQMKSMIGWMKDKFANIKIVAGCVTTIEATRDLANWGADSVRVGIGSGYVCRTKDVTGVTMPMFSAVIECTTDNKIPVVADGGARKIGDLSKALGAGAAMIQTGYFFAGCKECPKLDGKNTYRGMSTQEAAVKIRSGELPVSEGASIEVEEKGSVLDVLKDIHGGLRSSYSYVGAHNTKEFRTQVKFGFRHNK